MLPVRDGLNPTRLRLPQGDWATVVDYLLARFPDDAVRLHEKIAEREVVDESGTPITTETPYAAVRFVYLYRDPPVEPRVPFEIDILHRDDNLLVVDKPHFLASTPRGGFIVESALVRLRRDLDLPELSPAHRLDRLTAGVLVFTMRPAVRRAYQMLFAERSVRKTYEAVAGFDPALQFPRTVRSRIIKERSVLQAQEVPGEPNAETRIALVERVGDNARYALEPKTGKTHQLRVHLSSLGIPIVGDSLYPTVRDVAPDDYSQPLRLLARSIEFDDPFSGLHRRFESRRILHSPLLS
ncbi:pseudouridine synthase [Antrihabitans stalactiti]|uniref:RNA pseudouridylate synthase n=1 Tax=Antrihabitans stalactiti TaxID=2584121 RepID=A0A848KDN9_9NOCA|nr:pseudouridine synthase [Antrihabitans stalactiti]NMN96419.1 pseudouridine synthase [Antrihabitans stalactiti]